MNRIILTIIGLCTTLFCMAIPANGTWQTAVLEDGTEISVLLVGDEHGHWFVDSLGRKYTVTDGIATPLTSQRMEAILQNRRDRIAMISERRSQRAAMHLNGIQNTLSKRSLPHQTRAVTDEQYLYSGEKRALVLLVEFSNKKMSYKGTQAAFDKRFNQEGFNEHNHIGSVRDYFLAQSYGAFDLTFDVVGPLTLSKVYSYYGQNDRNGDDLHPCEMVTEAVKLADDAGVDFSQYDWDGDGEVDQVFIIYAGYGENAQAEANTIWPHEWDLTSGKVFNDGKGPVKVDGVMVDTYAVSCELANSYGTTLNGIGTACHEFSHCMGYPDFYDSTYSGGAGMLDWDLLDRGSYNGPSKIGEVPCGFTAYERWMAGWLEPIVLDHPMSVLNMPSLTLEPAAYVIYNDADDNECFLLENRQNDSWDYYVGGEDTHGLLITHVDYSAKAWEDNTVNTEANHQRMTFMPADNNRGTNLFGNWSASAAQLAGDPFPGSRQKTTFSDSTTPRSTVYNKNLDGTYKLGKPVTDITENTTDGTISFKFMGGDENAIHAITASQTSTSPRIYNLNGQQINSSTHLKPGIYIVNGRLALF